jgi:hypothetical protein
VISAIHLRPPADLDTFAVDAQAVLTALSERPGFVRGQLLRAFDDDGEWLLLTEWESVGAYRRGLGGYQVKLLATPLMAHAVDQPSAFEPLATVDPAGSPEIIASDRAPS